MSNTTPRFYSLSMGVSGHAPRSAAAKFIPTPAADPSPLAALPLPYVLLIWTDRVKRLICFLLGAPSFGVLEARKGRRYLRLLRRRTTLIFAGRNCMISVRRGGSQTRCVGQPRLPHRSAREFPDVPMISTRPLPMTFSNYLSKRLARTCARGAETLCGPRLGAGAPNEVQGIPARAGRRKSLSRSLQCPRKMTLTEVTEQLGEHLPTRGGKVWREEIPPTPWRRPRWLCFCRRWSQGA